MKVIFVDAENTGLPAITKIKANACDKVYVFSKNEKVKEECEHRLFYYLSGYQPGKNQADFYLISVASQQLNELNIIKRNGGVKAVNFELYSNDKPLIQAFKHLCKVGKVHCRVVTRGIHQAGC
ncbi:hypothetical protein M3914_003318 [Vibrio metschnikovii]|nr:hypothetical protein [Vibrio metschnikovii]